MDDISLENLNKVYELIVEVEEDRRRYPILDPDSMVYANLATHAVNYELVCQVEKMCGKDVLWSEALEYGDERDDDLGKILVLRQPEMKFEMPVLRDKWKPPKRLFEVMSNVHGMLSSPTGITRTDVP